LGFFAIKTRMRYFLLILAVLLVTDLSAQSLFKEINSYTNQQLLSIHTPNNSTCYVTGDHGVFKKSTDGGQTWSPLINTGTNQALWQVSSPNTDTTGQFVYIAGDVPDVFKSRDGGSTFQVVSTGLPTGSYLFGINVIDTLHIYACGITPSGGCFVRTSDGGYNWDIVPFSSSAFLFKTFFIDSLHGYVTGSGASLSSGSVYKTLDGGRTWQQVKTSSAYLTNITCLNKDTCVAVGAHGQIYLTTNSGNTWADKSIDTTSLFGVAAWSEKVFYAIGGNNGDSTYLYYSDDAGQTWTKHYTGYKDRSTGLQVSTDGTIYASAQKGKVLKSIVPVSIKSNPYPAIELQIFPNPASSWLILKGGGMEHYRIVNSLGQSVIAPKCGDDCIDVSQLPNGVYYLVYQTIGGAGQAMFTISRN
jgi:photosystem II stability/assembly factor-like uncharacterized protein